MIAGSNPSMICNIAAILCFQVPSNSFTCFLECLLGVALF